MVDPIRLEAWKYGRTRCDQLVSQYCQEYGIKIPPPPALIADELLTDFLGVTLRYDPLGLDIFAQTEWRDDRALVTVNALTAQIPGVIDAAGVQNVAKFHEMVHVERDLAVLQHGSRLGLPESGPSPNIVCYREFDIMKSTSSLAGVDNFREFWAEEAGRAAAISYAALYRSDGFRSFLTINEQGTERTNSLRWKSLVWAAADIGVNRSALTKQLELEGLIRVIRTAGANMVYPQPKLFSLMGAR